MSGTVTVALKLPNGLRLRIYNMVEDNEPTQQGYKKIARAEPIRDESGDIIEVVLRGWNDDQQAGFRNSRIAIPAAPGAFALTHGVDADFMKKWMEDNKDQEIVKKGLICVSENERTIERHLLKKDKLMSGLEPVDPLNPPKAMRVQPDDAMKDRLEDLKDRRKFAQEREEA